MCDQQPNAKLKPQYEGHHMDFWVKLQRLHDRDMHWRSNDQGGADLSEYGRLYVREIFIPDFQ